MNVDQHLFSSHLQGLLDLLLHKLWCWRDWRAHHVSQSLSNLFDRITFTNTHAGNASRDAPIPRHNDDSLKKHTRILSKTVSCSEHLHFVHLVCVCPVTTAGVWSLECHHHFACDNQDGKILETYTSSGICNKKKGSSSTCVRDESRSHWPYELNSTVTAQGRGGNPAFRKKIVRQKEMLIMCSTVIYTCRSCNMSTHFAFQFPIAMVGHINTITPPCVTKHLLYCSWLSGKTSSTRSVWAISAHDTRSYIYIA